jgi:hypothetical protein
VLGGGALGAFGPHEVTYLCVLALALGEHGRQLSRPGGVSGFEDAAVRAFDAYPAPLAALRVAALLDPRVRGNDPARVEVSRILRESATFRALAHRVLELIARG